MDNEVITNETRLTRIQALVVEILNDLLRAPIEDTDATIQSGIARIGAWCRRDRSYVFVLRDGLVFNTHEWCGPGIEPAIDHLQGLPWVEYGPLTEPMERGEPFHVPDIDELPAESAARELLAMQQIRSILMVPMRHEGATYGFIGFDGVEQTHAFLPGELYLLQSVADVICTVLTRREREQAVARAQAELARERAFLASVLATSAMGIMVLDEDGVIRFVNDAAETISGLPRAELIGRHHASPDFALTQEGGERFAPGTLPFDLVVASDRPAPEIRFELHCPDGVRYCAIHAAPILGARIEGARVVYAMIDVTEQVQAEHARTEALEDARRANAAKSNFLAKMSHEMRTPLNGVLGITEVLERQIADPDQRRMIGVARESGHLLLSIINDLLDMTKIEADRLEIEVIPFAPGDVAQRLESVHTLKASERQLSFAVRLLGDGTLLRMGDPHRLMQVLHNLISNAIKFTEEGAVEVRIDCTEPDRLGIVVVDTGIGMTPEAVVHVFEDFEQADSTIARRFGGTGLGMAIVQNLVRMMGGTVALDSQPGVGTRVSVDLPQALAPASAVPGALAPTADSDILPDGVDLSGLRVLAVDDNRTNRMILGALLGQLGVSAVTVGDGQAALGCFDGQPFDLVILDISMPGMDGVTVMHEMRRRIAARRGPGKGPGPRILAYTANAMSHQVEGYLRAGFDDCLTKPLQLKRLSDALIDSLPSPLQDAPDNRTSPVATVP